MKGPDRNARDQLLRASQSIPLNIAEGNRKLTAPDRGRYFRIAIGSSLECAAILDVLEVCGVIQRPTAQRGKKTLARIVEMLTRLAERSG